MGLATVPPGWDVEGRCGEGPRGGPGVGERGGVGRGAGSDDPSPQRIAVTDGSRASQPSGRELLPALPPRDFVVGGLTIAPQLVVGDGALGFWPALSEVFPATRQPRGRVHQPADVLRNLGTSPRPNILKRGNS